MKNIGGSSENVLLLNNNASFLDYAPIPILTIENDQRQRSKFFKFRKKRLLRLTELYHILENWKLPQKSGLSPPYHLKVAESAANVSFWISSKQKKDN